MSPTALPPIPPRCQYFCPNIFLPQLAIERFRKRTGTQPHQPNTSKVGIVLCPQ
jgi:hypothetical protein